MHRPNNKINKGNHYELLLTNRNNRIIGRSKVDKIDYKKINICRWGLNTTTKTTQGFVNQHMTAMHIVIMGKKKEYVIDHINHDPLDNRRSNLRYATKSQNGMNQKGVLGVCRLARKDLKKNWLMQIHKDNKTKKSYHYTKKEAIQARRKAEKELFGDYAYQR